MKTNEKQIRMSLQRIVCLLAFCGFSAGASSAGEPILSTYLESHGRDWREWRNWDTGVVPSNTANDTYAVLVPQSRRVELDWFGTTEVDSLVLENNASVLLYDGLFRPGAVSFAENAYIQAQGGDAEFNDPSGDWSRANLIAGAGSTMTGVVDQINNCEVLSFQATDTDALIDFSALSVVQGEHDALFYANAVRGTVDLSALSTLDATSSWSARDGGTITAGPFVGTNIASITVDPGSWISLPGSLSLNGTEVRLHDDAQLITGPITSMDGARIIVDEGAQFEAPVTQITSLNDRGVTLEVDRGSIRLLSLTRIDHTTQDDSSNLFLTNGSLILPQLREILGPGIVRLTAESGNLRIQRLERVEPDLLLSLSGTRTFGDIEFGRILSLTLGDADVTFAGEVDLTDTQIRLNGTSQISFGTLLSLDDASVNVSGQSVFAPQIVSIADASWSVSDFGLLDLTGVSEINLPPEAGPYSRSTFDVRHNGQIMIGSGNLRIDAGPNAYMRFKSWENGRILFGASDITAGPGSYCDFIVDGPDAEIDFTQISSINGLTAWLVEDGGSIIVPASLNLDGARSIYLGGGTLHLPGLQTYNEMALQIIQDTDFIMGAVVGDSIHNMSVYSRRDWSVPGSTLTWDRPGGHLVFGADHCTLNAPKLTTIVFDPEPIEEPVELSIAVGDNALVDLSAVTTIHGPPSGSGYALKIRTDGNNSVLDLSSVETTSGIIKIDADRYGSLLFWGADIVAETDHDDLTGSSVRIWNAGHLICGGSFTTTLTDNLIPSFSYGTLEFRSVDTESFEAYMEDFEFVYNPQGRQISFLVIGSDDVPTRLAMVEAVDNGHRGKSGEPEAVYIGSTNSETLEESLTLAAGSSIVLNGIPVYVQSEDKHVRLNDLFPENQRAFPFSEGMIYRVDPDLCPADFTSPFGALDFFDVQTFLTLFSSGDPEADLVPDGIYDFFDVQSFLMSFSSGCP